jgi:DNA-3-methyladenine glycosylase II
MQIALRHLKTSDPVLRGLIERVGPFRMEYREPTFETLVRSIVFQQLSGNVARVIFGRLAAAMPAGGAVTPDAILRLRPERMRKLGLSLQKTNYIRDLARLTASGALDFAALPGADDLEVIAALTQVKGVGVWTAQMFLIFALARPDVLATGDLGIRKAMRIAYGLDELPKPHTMEEIAAPWRPHCSAACWYLWRSLDGEAGI